MIVNAGTYPVNPISMSYVDQRLKEEELLQDPRLAKQCIVDVSEIELVEGIAESGGPALNTLLSTWKESTLANVSLKNYLISEDDARRPARIDDESKSLFDGIIKRLGFSDREDQVF